MNDAEFLKRCAALIEKMGRGPKWKGSTGVAYTLFAPDEVYSSWHAKSWGECLVATWWFNHLVTPHEAICILKYWLEEELRIAGYALHVFANGYCEIYPGVFRTIGDPPYRANNTLTALIEVAEKVLVKEKGEKLE